ncbi:MAG: BatA domain-containing protein [Opitutus sp.]
MSLLAPWFLLGFALIGGPIIAHLIRRATRERVTFSSLRLLEPSPPRLDRRSRVQNPWLLALRCLIVAVLAFGFARPFFRHTPAGAKPPARARHVVAILDESASMRRSGLWDAARSKITNLVGTLHDNDRLVLLTAGTSVHELITSAQWTAALPSDRAGLVRTVLESRQAGWGPTPLDSAVETALSRWEDMAESNDASARHELVIVSDFAAGARTAGLANVDWPASTEVTLEDVTPNDLGNASLHWLGWAEPADGKLAARVRITRSFDAPEALHLQWRNALTDAPVTEREAVTLLPGASEVRLIPWPGEPSASLVLELSGDRQPFDNRLWLTHAPPQSVEIGYVGGDAADDSRHARFYIERAISGWREPIAHLGSDLPATAGSANLVIVTSPPDSAALETLRGRVTAGAFALVLLSSDEMVRVASELAQEPGWTATAPDRADALLGQVDFKHPLFAAFADPLFSDFTRIHFWQPRSIALPAGSKATVAARFEDGSPAVIETVVGQGRLVVWGGDWSPAASQWVLSSKFVPWLQSLAERAAGGSARPAIAEIGDTRRLLANGVPAQWRRLSTPIAASLESTSPEEPGIYELTQGNDRRTVSVLVPRAESEAKTISLDTWEQLGVPVRLTAEQREASTARDSLPAAAPAVLENQQQLWRWLLWVAVALLALESLAAFAIARSRGDSSQPVANR